MGRTKKSDLKSFQSPEAAFDDSISKARPRRGTLRKQRDSVDAIGNFLAVLSSTSFSMPSSPALDQFFTPNLRGFQREEFERYISATCGSEESILAIDYNGLIELLLTLDVAADAQRLHEQRMEEEVLEEIDFIQQLPEIDLLINSLVTRLNNRGSDSIFCLPAVVGCLSLVLKGNELENVVLSEKNIIQLMRLCLSRAVYPNTADSNPLPFAAYQEICVCRIGLRGLLATSTVAQSIGAQTEINTFITKWCNKNLLLSCLVSTL